MLLAAGLFLLASACVIVAHLHRRLQRADAYSRSLATTLDTEYARLQGTREELEHAVLERRRAQAGHADMAAAVEHTDALILILDLQWRITYVNPAFERATGFTRETAIGRPIDTAGGLGDGETRGALESAVREGRAWSGRLINRRSDATSYHAEASISPIRDAAGRITRYVAVLRDASREIALEAQLRHSQKLESIGTLAGGIAHDFNNLLVPILGCTEAARERVHGDEEMLQLLGDVKNAAERARDLVAQILTFSRKAEPTREARPVAPTIREAARLLRAMLPAGIRIEERIADDAGAVRADATELHQVIMNLATNGYHAMRRSGGILTLAAECVGSDALAPGATPAPAGRYVRITVGDTGIGMDARTLERIFDPFFTTKAAGEGTGLGLAMVHGTVAALGGSIDMKSWPGAGTIVRIDLPAATSEPPVETPAPAATISIHGLHVLLVDDEITVRRVAHRMLERGGFRVTDAESAGDALARFRARPDAFDAVLTDYNMPGMTGLELAAELHGLRANLPVILASGYVDAETLQSAEECGIRRVVHKPFSPSEIAGAVVGAVGEAG